MAALTSNTTSYAHSLQMVRDYHAGRAGAVTGGALLSPVRAAFSGKARNSTPRPLRLLHFVARHWLPWGLPGTSHPIQTPGPPPQSRPSSPSQHGRRPGSPLPSAHCPLGPPGATRPAFTVRGYAWVTLMVATAVSTLPFRWRGPAWAAQAHSPVIPVTLGMLVMAFVCLARRNVVGHPQMMQRTCRQRLRGRRGVHVAARAFSGPHGFGPSADLASPPSLFTGRPPCCSKPFVQQPQMLGRIIKTRPYRVWAPLRSALAGRQPLARNVSLVAMVAVAMTGLSVRHRIGLAAAGPAGWWGAWLVAAVLIAGVALWLQPAAPQA